MLTFCIQKTLKMDVGNYVHPTTLISTTPHVQHAAAFAKLVNCCTVIGIFVFLKKLFGQIKHFT